MKLKLKPFQREDIARLSLHPGGVLAFDTGLGKSLAAYLWSLLKVGFTPGASGPVVSAPVLLVASGDLHAQLIEEGRKHFGITPIILDSQARFLQLATLNPATGQRELPPAFYLTTYTQLARNGVQPFPESAADFERMFTVGPNDVEEFWNDREARHKEFYQRLLVGPKEPEHVLKAAWFRLRKAHSANSYTVASLDEAYYTLKDYAATSFDKLTPEQLRALRLRFLEVARVACAQGIGTEKNGIRCVYSPSLSELSRTAFKAVVADEGVKLKGEDTLVGMGTRLMRPDFRLVMTATPVKNRLPDIFHLIHWAVGGRAQAHPRFPFGADDHETFATEFSVTERNLSQEERTESGKRFKRTPQVCQIHRLWKLLAPNVLRRRKKDCGEEIVPKLHHLVRVPMGQKQAAVYETHLAAKYIDKNGDVALGAKLQALRIAAANPCSELLTTDSIDLRKAPFNGSYPPVRSSIAERYIPKLASALTLIHEILQRREQVVVFSAFHDSLDTLAHVLNEASVKHLLLDGRMSPGKRGTAAAVFKRGWPGQVPVMLAGVECMSEGHSFHLCNNVILLAYSWAYDKYEQAINRVHRMNSEKPVNVYSIICDGSIDPKLDAMRKEKGDAAELVLDGQLLGEDHTEVNLFELLKIAQAEFAGTAKDKLIDEKELAKSWPALRVQLSDAMRAWRCSAVSTPLPLLPPVQIPTVAVCKDPDWLLDMPLWRQAA